VGVLSRSSPPARLLVSVGAFLVIRRFRGGRFFPEARSPGFSPLVLFIAPDSLVLSEQFFGS